MDSAVKRFEPLWGSWQVEEFLGEGSFGKVWRVTDGIKHAAVKEIIIPRSKDTLAGARAEGLDMEGAKRYFEETAKATLTEARLMQEHSECPYIVRFEEAQLQKLEQENEFGWVIFIRMEELQSFKEMVTVGTLTVPDVLKLGTDICKALEKCEQAGVVHRDIKPDNLFYSKSEHRYKLGDFGIAHYLARPTQGKGRAGTLTHMSPEIYSGAEFTAAGDRYALGMILYRLLNDNRIPFLPQYPEPFTPAMRDEAMVKRLKGAEIGPPRTAALADRSAQEMSGLGVTVDEKSRKQAEMLGRIAQRAISADPGKRFASAGEFREALDQLCNGMVF